MLTGPSVVLDPLTHAVRADLADVRLADRVFAPHYAAPCPRRLARDADLMSDASDSAQLVVHLTADAPFEALEFSGEHVWGIASDLGLVGYLRQDAIAAGARC